MSLTQLHQTGGSPALPDEPAGGLCEKEVIICSRVPDRTKRRGTRLAILLIMRAGARK